MSDEGLLAYIVQLEKMFVKTDAEVARLREALERVARHDLQAIALDASAPGERIRAVDMKIVDEKPDLPRSISFQVGELGVSKTEEKP